MASSESRRDARRIQSNLDKLIAWASVRREPMPQATLKVIKESLATDFERLVHRSEILEQTPMLVSVEHGENGAKTVTIDMRDGTTRSFQTLVDFLSTPPVDYRIADALATAEEAQRVAVEAELREAAAQERVERLEAQLEKSEEERIEAERVIDQALPVITSYLERREAAPA